MTVYKYFMRIASNKKTVIITYTLVFLFLSIINGGTNEQRETSFIESRMNIGVINNSEDELARSLENYLAKKNNVVHMPDDEVYIKEQIFLEYVSAVVIIPQDFRENALNKEKAVQIYRDDRVIETYQIENQINKFISFSNAAYEDGEFNLTKVNDALDQEVSVSLIETGNNINQRVNNWFRFYFNFTSYVILAIYIAVIGYVMSDFANRQVENRRKVSSIKFMNFNMQMYLGQLTIAGIITIVFILGSIILKGRYIGEVDFLKYVVNIIIFSFSSLCLVFLINNATSNKFVINAISTVLSLGTSFISGVMVPQQLLSEKVLAIARFFPTYYFVRINERDISSFMEVRYEIFMQLLFAAVFLLIGLYLSKSKQRA